MSFLRIAFAVLILIAVAIGVVAGWIEGKANPRPKPKRYVMRGYGGGKNATSLHPRQAKQGKRIVYIPGVGYRHVTPGKRSTKR